MSKSLEEVLIEYEIPLEDSSGGRKVTKCMFHAGDHEASFTIYPNGTYFCFGCDVWGDAVTFLVEYKGMTFDEAVAHVGADYKLRTADKPQVIKVKNTLDTYKFLYDVCEQYHQFLMGMPGALQYLEKRGLTMETIQKYKLGYTDGRVLHLDWAWDQQLALEIGLINKNGFELLSHRITIPNLTEEGFADFVIGRTVTNDKIKYLGARISKPIHGFYEVRHSPILFLAEGQFDWLTLRQWGYPAAVVGGTHLTRSNLTLIRDKKIIIVPDLDESNVGMNAAKRLQEQLGESCYILDYSELKVPGEKLDVSRLAETKGGQKLFQQIVIEAYPWINLLSNRILERWFPTLQPLHI
jgi:DNA primase